MFGTSKSECIIQNDVDVSACVSAIKLLCLIQTA